MSKKKKRRQAVQKTTSPKATQNGTKAKQSNKPVHKSTTPKAAQNKPQTAKKKDLTKKHPKFPFWARLKISKHRTTLVIDEEKSLNNKTNKVEDQFIHREATSPTDDENRNKKYERISPNPDKTKKDDMLLKSPRKLPKKLFELHNKKLEMPQHLKDKYYKNNNKDKKT